MLTALVAGLAAPAARADIFAVTDVHAGGPGTDTDIELIDTSTARGLPLPDGINTPDNESHPSISADGRWLVFRRRNGGGSNRIILADLATGTTSDLFTGFEAGMLAPTSPSVTPDGKAVLTGGSGSGPLLTDVSNFPTGPYAHTDIGGRSPTANPIATGSAPGSLLAFEEPQGAVSHLRFGKLGQTIFGDGGVGGELNAHPTIGLPAGVETIVFDFAHVTNGGPGKATLQACNPANPLSAGCPKNSLPGIGGSGDDTRPAFSPDGRYVAFIAADPTGQHTNTILLVWDSGTQEIISLASLSEGTPPDLGNVSLYERPVLKQALINPSGAVRFSLLSPANIGILVQRVTGHRRLFGRAAPRLGKARRVPLGSFGRGRGHAQWNLRVGGHRLRPGTYQVTLRALTRSGRIRDLGKPRLLRVRRH